VISVITVVYNGERHLAQAIESVAGQNCSGLEYIIIDGGSTDRTIEIIRKYEKNIDYWRSEEDLGISDAFNKGVACSKGKYIAFLGSDDWYEPGVIAPLMKELKSEKTIYSGSMNLISHPDGRLLKVHMSRPDRLLQTMRISHPASFTPRNLINESGGFSTSYTIAMDYDMMLKAWIAGYDFMTFSTVITNHRRGGVSRDLMTVFKEELIIKNTLLGKHMTHFVWYLANVVYFKARRFCDIFSKGKVK